LQTKCCLPCASSLAAIKSRASTELHHKKRKYGDSEPWKTWM